MRGDRLVQGLGDLLALLWVGAACAGYWPGQWAVAAQMWWWLAVSCAVLAVGGIVPCRVRVPEIGWGFLALGAGVLGWIPRMPGTVLWLSQLFLLLLAGWLFVERWGWRPLRKAVIWWAWTQVAVGGLWLCGWSPYTHADGWTGTMGQRSVLGAWLGLASLWSAKWRAWVLALMSLLTGSWTGGIALVRLLPVNWMAPAAWGAGASLLLVSGKLWMGKLWLRTETWGQALALIPEHWVTGWGLQALPVGFRETFQTSDVLRYAEVLDLHNTWLDVLVRGGSVGLVLLLTVMGWAWRKSVTLKTGWTWGFAAFVMTWQSVAAQPALLLLGLVWLLSLCRWTQEARC